MRMLVLAGALALAACGSSDEGAIADENGDEVGTYEMSGGETTARIKGDDMTSNPGPGHNGFSERLESYQAEEDAETDESPEPNVAEDAPAEPRAGTVDEAVEPDAQDEEFERALSAAVAAPEPKAEEAAPESVAEAAVVAPSASESPAETAGDKEVLAALDEAALRDIVAKLIREELQGELGERITRNVRKLVRREILRAMASREFE